jgi:hypothetical protein
MNLLNRLDYCLNENTDNINFDIIKKECSDIINVYNDTESMLYRGFYSSMSMPFYKKIPRTDRYPKDMASIYSNNLDAAFYNKFHWKPRSEGVFVSGRKTDARSYSKDNEVFCFFPCNGYKFLWSNVINDLYTFVFEDNNVNYLIGGSDDDGRNVYDGDGYDDEEYEEYIFDYFKIISEYKNTDLKSAIKSNNEIMFKCRYYYVIKSINDNPDTIKGLVDYYQTT